MFRQAAVTLSVSVTVAFAGPSGGGFELCWSTIDGGGGTSTGGGFTLRGSIGQVEAGGPLAGGDFELRSGFWPGAIPDGCRPDLNNDGDLNFFDVSAFLQAFNNQEPVADFNGDGLFNFFDVSAFLQEFNAGC